MKAISIKDESLEKFKDRSILDKMGAMLIIGLGLAVVIVLTLVIGRLCKCSDFCMRQIESVK